MRQAARCEVWDNLACVGAGGGGASGWTTQNERMAAVAAGLGGGVIGVLPAANSSFGLPEILLGTADLGTGGGVGTSVPLAIIPFTSVCRVTEEFRDYLVSRKLVVGAPRSWSDRSTLVGRRVLRLVYDDGTWHEFRITAVTDSVGRDDVVTVEAQDPIFDLAAGNTLVGTTTSGAVALETVDAAVTPSSALSSRVTAHLPSHWSVGTVTPTAAIDLETRQATPLAAALAIAQAANKAAGTTATPYRISSRANGSSGYYVDLTDYNGSMTALDLRSGVMMSALTRRLETAEQATRVYPFGAEGQHCGAAIWEVSAISTNTYVELVDIGGGPGPVQEADQYKDLYLRKAAGGTQQITGTSRQSLGTSRFNVAATAGFTAGDYVRIVADSSETDLPYVDCVTNKATYGIQVATLQAPYPAASNLLKNADLRSGTPPTSWTASGGGVEAIDTTVGNWLTGNRSVKLTSSPRVWEQTVTVQVPASGEWHAVYLTRWKGDPTSGAGTVQMGAYVDGVEISSALNLDEWFDGTWVNTYRSTKLVAGSRALKVSISMGRVMWFDSAAIYVTAGSAVQHPFMIGSGAARLIQDANNYLTLNSAPVATYTADVLDLFRLDPVTWATQQVALGQPANVTEPDLSISATGLRVVRVDTNHLVPHDTKLTLATRRPTLTSTLVKS